MSSRAGSSIGAFLVSLPVSAMLLMMVFGVPRFAPGTNGETGWDQARQFFQQFRGESKSSGDKVFSDYPPTGSAAASEDPFARVTRGGPAGEAPRWGAAAAPEAAATGADPRLARNSESAPRSPWPFSGASQGGGSPTDAPGLDRRSGELTHDQPPRAAGGLESGAFTWTEARRRLAELGIHEFHLEPGLERDQYLFVCLFTPGDDARVTHRFEAEAGDPLAAVQDVLSQVDGWLSQRYAERSQQIIQPFGGHDPVRR